MRCWLLILVACDAGKKPDPPAKPATAPPPTAAPADAIPAPPIIPDAPPAEAATPVDAPVVDPNAIQITWVVFPPSVAMKRDPEMLFSPLTLQVTAGGV